MVESLIESVDDELLDKITYDLFNQFDDHSKEIIGNIESIVLEMNEMRSLIKSDIEALDNSNSKNSSYLKKELHEKYSIASKNVIDGHSKIFDILDKRNKTLSSKLNELRKITSTNDDEGDFNPSNLVKNLTKYANKQLSEESEDE